jgi:hypothetical protein
MTRPLRTDRLDRRARVRLAVRARGPRACRVPAPPDPPVAPLLAAARADLRAGAGGPPDLARLRRQFETAADAADDREPREDGEV